MSPALQTLLFANDDLRLRTGNRRKPLLNDFGDPMVELRALSLQ